MTKYTLSWNKSCLQIKSEISDLFCRLFSSTYSVFVAGCYKINDFFQTAPHMPFGKYYFVLLLLTTNTLQGKRKKSAK